MALISFDLDGVLQRNPFHSSSPHGVFGHISRELGPCLGLPNANEAAAHALHLILEEHRTRTNAGHLVEAHDWDGIVSVVAAHIGYSGRLDVAALVTEYCEKPDLVYAYPGTAECLEALAAAGHTLVSITNGFRSYQEPVLRKLGILHFFKALLTPEAVGAAKPQGGIYKAAEAHGGRGIHIGDTLPHDVAGAKRAGWKAIYVCQPGAPGATDLPAELAALAPWERPAAGADWLRFRLEQDRVWHSYPPCELDECTPDAIVHSLLEIPGTIERI